MSAARRAVPRGTGYLVAAVAHLARVTALSAIPGPSWRSLGIVVWDKLVHVAEFAPLGFFVASFVLVRGRSARLRWARALVAATIAAGIAGAADELHQWFVPGRSASVLDGVADAVGGAAGAALAIAWRAGRGRRASR